MINYWKKYKTNYSLASVNDEEHDTITVGDPDLVGNPIVSLIKNNFRYSKVHSLTKVDPKDVERTRTLFK